MGGGILKSQTFQKYVWSFSAIRHRFEEGFQSEALEDFCQASFNDLWIYFIFLWHNYPPVALILRR